MGKAVVETRSMTSYAHTYRPRLVRRVSEQPQRRRQGKLPDQLQQHLALRTRGMIRKLIRSRFGVTLSIRGVGEYLARWGYTPQKPARQTDEREDLTIRDWLTVEHPKIRALAKRDNAEVCWVNGTRVRPVDSRHRGCAPRGQMPIIRAPAHRKCLSMIAAVTNQGKVGFMIYGGDIKPQRLILFRRRLTRHVHR